MPYEIDEYFLLRHPSLAETFFTYYEKKEQTMTKNLKMLSAGLLASIALLSIGTNTAIAQGKKAEAPPHWCRDNGAGDLDTCVTANNPSTGIANGVDLSHAGKVGWCKFFVAVGLVDNFAKCVSDAAKAQNDN